jgi:PAS domain S-box-containing protein
MSTKSSILNLSWRCQWPIFQFFTASRLWGNILRTINSRANSLVRRVTLLGTAVLLLATTALLLWASLERANDADRSIERTYHVLNLAERLFSDLEGAESADRGYLITGDERYLAPYRSAAADAPEALKALQRLPAGSQQRLRLRRIEQLANERLDLLAHCVGLVRQGKASEAVALARAGKGLLLMDQLRPILGELKDEEHRSLANRLKEVQQQDNYTRLILMAGGSALVLLLVLAGGIIERDIDHRNRSEQKLKQQAGMIDLSHDAIITTDADWHITGWNRGAQELYGWTEAEALGRVSHELVQASSNIPVATIEHVLSGEDRWEGELVHTRSDGQKLVVESRQVLISDDSGVPIGILQINRDITAHKHAEEALLESEENLRLALQSAEMGMWDWNIGTGVLVWSDRCRELFGFGPQAAVTYQLFLAAVHPDDRVRVDQAVRETLEKRTDYDFDMRVLLPRSAVRWVECKGRVHCDNTGQPIRMRGIVQDITERKRNEIHIIELNRDLDRRVKELNASFQQRNVLLKEVQHRVKNNLQVISSLLSLEAERFENSDFHRAMLESRDRVRSIGLIHEKFCHSDDLTQIDFAEFVDTLARSLLNSYTSSATNIQLSTGVDVKLGMDEAIPCGLILQELLSNSIKHAFPTGTGEIRIEFHDQDGEFELRYRDSGVGLPATIDLRNPESLGLQLVTDLVRQLRGNLDYRTDGGAVFTVTFKLERDRGAETEPEA